MCESYTTGIRYPADFKQRAVRLVTDDGWPISAVARELKISSVSLRLWIQQAGYPDFVDLASRFRALRRMECLSERS